MFENKIDWTFLFLILCSISHPGFAQFENDVMKALGNHGDRITDLETLIKRLTDGQTRLLQEVSTLKTENAGLKDEIKNLTDGCCSAPVDCLNSNVSTLISTTQSYLSSLSSNLSTTESSPASIEMTTSSLNASTNYFTNESSPATTESSPASIETSTSSLNASTNYFTNESSPSTTKSSPASIETTFTSLNASTSYFTNESSPATTESSSATRPFTANGTFPIGYNFTTLVENATTTTISTTASTTSPATTTRITSVISTNALTTPMTTTPGEKVYANCNDAIADNRRNGTYLIGNDVTVMKANCKIENGFIWLVIQRRINGNVDFNRTWNEYAAGFGDLNSEFWLGNDNLFYLTSETGDYTLRIEMDDWGGNHVYAEYSHFQVQGPSLDYVLTVGSYKGTAGDSFHYPQSYMLTHHSMPFSTPDVDNDHSPMNCAKELQSGWWFNSCYSSNLNGQYLPGAYGQRMLGESAGQPTTEGTGIEWYPYRRRQYSMRHVEIKIRLSQSPNGVLIG